MRRPRAPSPRAGPRPSQPTPAQAWAFPSPSPCPSLRLPRDWRGRRGAVSCTYTTALEIIQDTIFPGARTPARGRVGAERGGPGRQRQAARSPAPRAPRGRAGALGSRAGCMRAAAGAARRSVPRPSPPVPARGRAAAEPSRPRPCTPLIGGGGGGGASAEAGSGRQCSGGWAVGTPADAGKPRGPGLCVRTSTSSLHLWDAQLAWRGRGGWREAETGNLRVGIVMRCVKK